MSDPFTPDEIEGIIDSVCDATGLTREELKFRIRGGGVGSPDTQLAKSGEPVRTDTK